MRTIENPDLERTIGARIRAARALRGMNQQTLAERIGLTFQQIHKYEQGINRCSVSRLLHIASETELPMSFFVDDILGVQSTDIHLASSLRIAARLNQLHPRARSLVLSMIEMLEQTPLVPLAPAAE